MLNVGGKKNGIKSTSVRVNLGISIPGTEFELKNAMLSKRTRKWASPTILPHRPN